MVDQSNIDDHLKPYSKPREVSPTLVPHIPMNARQEKYQTAVDEYLAGNLTEDELEAEIWDALRGRLEYHEAINALFETDRFTTWIPEGSTLKCFGVMIEEGQPLLLEEIPSPEETLDVVE